MQIYPIDFEIVRLLYRLIDDDQILASMDILTEVQVEIIKDEMSKYLSEIGYTQDKVIDMLEEIFSKDQKDISSEKYKKLLSNPVLEKRISDRVQNFNRSIYDAQIPLLSKEVKVEFDKYVGLLRRKFELDKEATLMVLDYAKRVNELKKQEVPINVAQVKATPTINLGGSLKSSRPTQPQASIQSQSTVTVAQQSQLVTDIQAPPVTQPQVIPTQPVQPITPIDIAPPQPKPVGEGEVLGV